VYTYTVTIVFCLMNHITNNHIEKNQSQTLTLGQKLGVIALSVLSAFGTYTTPKSAYATPQTSSQPVQYNLDNVQNRNGLLALEQKTTPDLIVETEGSISNTIFTVGMVVQMPDGQQYRINGGLAGEKYEKNFGKVVYNQTNTREKLIKLFRSALPISPNSTSTPSSNPSPPQTQKPQTNPSLPLLSQRPSTPERLPQTWVIEPKSISREDVLYAIQQKIDSGAPFYWGDSIRIVGIGTVTPKAPEGRIHTLFTPIELKRRVLNRWVMYFNEKERQNRANQVRSALPAITATPTNTQTPKPAMQRPTPLPIPTQPITASKPSIEAKPETLRPSHSTEDSYAIALREYNTQMEILNNQVSALTPGVDEEKIARIRVLQANLNDTLRAQFPEQFAKPFTNAIDNTLQNLAQQNSMPQVVSPETQPQAPEANELQTTPLQNLTPKPTQPKPSAPQMMQPKPITQLPTPVATPKPESKPISNILPKPNTQQPQPASQTLSQLPPLTLRIASSNIPGAPRPLLIGENARPLHEVITAGTALVTSNGSNGSQALLRSLLERMEDTAQLRQAIENLAGFKQSTNADIFPQTPKERRAQRHEIPFSPQLAALHSLSTWNLQYSPSSGISTHIDELKACLAQSDVELKACTQKVITNLAQFSPQRSDQFVREQTNYTLRQMLFTNLSQYANAQNKKYKILPHEHANLPQSFFVDLDKKMDVFQQQPTEANWQAIMADLTTLSRKIPVTNSRIRDLLKTIIPHQVSLIQKNQTLLRRYAASAAAISPQAEQAIQAQIAANDRMIQELGTL
jgi:hypothetical protein